MCTAITYKTSDHYFGRTLDLEYCYNERVTVTPRNYKFDFRQKLPMKKHYAIIGMATVIDDYPLYYDAVNEHGLAMAGLNFPGNVHYFPVDSNKDNITPFEFIPWILGQCKNLNEARELLEHINLCDINFNEAFPLSPLHWMLADKDQAIVVESMKDGLKIYDNPVGVMTNNPPFDYHMLHLCDYMHLATVDPINHFPGIDLKTYSRAMGAMGLPGDWSSASRFVRAAFVKLNGASGESEDESVGQFFHMLGAVEMPKGCVYMADGSADFTQYTSCMNTDKGIYYYTTYENQCIQAVDMHHCDLNSEKLVTYPLSKKMHIIRQN